MLKRISLSSIIDWECGNFIILRVWFVQQLRQIRRLMNKLPWYLGDFHLFPLNELCYVSSVTYWGSLSASRTLLALSCWVFLPLLATFFILILFKCELLLPWILLIASLVGFFNALNSLSEVGQFCYMLCIISNNSFICRRACSTSPSRRTSLKEEASTIAP